MSPSLQKLPLDIKRRILYYTLEPSDYSTPKEPFSGEMEHWNHLVKELVWKERWINPLHIGELSKCQQNKEFIRRIVLLGSAMSLPKTHTGSNMPDEGIPSELENFLQKKWPSLTKLSVLFQKNLNLEMLFMGLKKNVPKLQALDLRIPESKIALALRMVKNHQPRISRIELHTRNTLSWTDENVGIEASLAFENIPNQFQLLKISDYPMDSRLFQAILTSQQYSLSELDVSLASGATSKMATQGLRFETDAFRKIHPAEFNRRFLQENIRQCGRNFDQFRKISMTKNAITTGNGSATVRLGNSTVVCGIKAEVGEPLLSDPEKGFLVPNIELSPLCSSKFRPGPPSDQAQVISEYLYRIFDDKNILDLSTLSIVPGEAVWVLHADLVCLNYDGNVADAAIMAMSLALANTKLPKAELDEATGMVTANQNELAGISLQTMLYPSTFAVMEGRIVADPSKEEESLCDSFLTIVLDKENNLVNVWKLGANGFAMDQIERCVGQAITHKEQIEKIYSNPQ
ncbi:hypothetical protein H4219_004208 [Mycoemilia scoparia]|uniref:Ribosomal RNA-processing protein 43 n=1 Tax=Mycoemilia scoparia TaxID=417184 RepID=A0A9W7ZSE1_9FUNG|nr:hypothetical protein H4219_004208 [Mycoemilia scoparia]